MWESSTLQGPVAFHSLYPLTATPACPTLGGFCAVSQLLGAAAIEYWGLETDSVSHHRLVQESEFAFTRERPELQNLEIRFDGIGRTFRFSELANLDRPEFRAEINRETGWLTIAAKRNLGRVRLANRIEVPVSTVPTERLFAVLGLGLPRFGEFSHRAYESKAQAYRRAGRHATRRYRAELRVQSETLGTVRLESVPSVMSPVVVAQPTL